MRNFMLEVRDLITMIIIPVGLVLLTIPILGYGSLLFLGLTVMQVRRQESANPKQETKPQLPPIRQDSNVRQVRREFVCRSAGMCLKCGSDSLKEMLSHSPEIPVHSLVCIKCDPRILGVENIA